MDAISPIEIDDYQRRGWLRFPAEFSMLAWINAAIEATRDVADWPSYATWLRNGGTWFVGVDALENDAEGRVGDGPPLSGRAVDFIHAILLRQRIASHRGQVSICYPGYPAKDRFESASAHQYRVKRAAAHVDGLHGEGPDKRRHMREMHDFILGIPLDDVDAGAAPFVVWEGSHRIMQKAFQAAYDGIDPDRFGDVDVTEIYQAARSEVFDTCQRVEVLARVGECYLAHRFSLHGVAPWAGSELASRAIVYFRPCHFSAMDWLTAP